MNADPATAIFLLADSDFGHMDGGWWIVMAVGMILFWALFIVGLVWVVREFTRRGGTRLRRDPLELLDRRLAEGTISPEDYRQRREILTGLQSEEEDDGGP